MMAKKLSDRIERHVGPASKLSAAIDLLGDVRGELEDGADQLTVEMVLGQLDPVHRHCEQRSEEALA